jgi:hypothetical protein
VDEWRYAVAGSNATMPVFPDAENTSRLFSKGTRKEILDQPNVVSVPKLGVTIQNLFQSRAYFPRLSNGTVRIAVCGDSDAGKDILSTWAGMMCGAKVISISFAALTPMLALGMLCEAEHQAIHVERVGCRDFWHAVGTELTSKDPTYLLRYALRSTGLEDLVLVTGIRNVYELEAAKREGLIDFSVLVQRQGTSDTTNEIGQSHTDLQIINTGDPHAMRSKISRLVRTLAKGK